MFQDLKLVVVFFGFLAHSFATIANFQWFSKLPSPLNGMVEGNHWDQWFSDGFGVGQPLALMVFNGCAPLDRRWNGYVPSLKSRPTTPSPNNSKIVCLSCGCWHRQIARKAAK